jgi:hypothetical protein
LNKAGDIETITIKAQQKDENRADAYRDALRDAVTFFELWSQLSNDVPQKAELMDQYKKAMNSK